MAYNQDNYLNKGAYVQTDGVTVRGQTHVKFINNEIHMSMIYLGDEVDFHPDQVEVVISTENAEQSIKTIFNPNVEVVEIDSEIEKPTTIKIVYSGSNVV